MESFNRHHILRKIWVAFPTFTHEDKIKTNLGAALSDDMFLAVVKQFINSAAFYLEIEKANDNKRQKPNNEVNNSAQPNISVTPAHSGGGCTHRVGRRDEFINSELLREHLQSHGLDYMLKEYAEKGSISDVSRRKLVNATVELLLKHSSHYPSKDAKLSASQAIIDLFPIFDTGDPRNTIFYSCATNTGYLPNKLKNLSARRKKAASLALGQTSGENEKVQEAENELSDKDFEFFKNCNVVAQQEEIQDRLKITVKQRLKLRTTMNSEQTEEAFPCFLKDPKLISLDFSYRYPNNYRNFLTRWPLYKNAAKAVFRECGITLNSTENIMDWHSDFHPFFYLLKLLPPRIKISTSYKSYIEHLVIFRKSTDLDEDDEDLPDRDTPFLVAIGEDEANIHHFMLKTPTQLLRMPPNFDMIRSFDFLFQTFLVLNYDFPPGLSNFLSFFSKFFYEMPDSKPSPRQHEIFLKLQNKLKDQ